MDRLLQSYLGRIKVGEAQTHKNLTAYPVLSSQLSALDYITLDEALKQGLTEKFYSEERLASPALRAMKAEHVGITVRESGEYRSDQGAIWQQISEKASRRGTRSS